MSGSTGDLEMAERRLTTPVGAEELKKLKLGDIVYIDGIVFTGREGVYRRIFEEGHPPPVDLRSLTNVTFHCSPAVGEAEGAEGGGGGGWKVPAVTATASFRFTQQVPLLLERHGVRVVIGKGGMSPEVYASAFRRFGAVYLNTVGYGIGAQYGRGIRRVREVHWAEELGLAQALWVFEVENLGPFLVECDARGESLFEMANREVTPELERLYADLPPPTLKRVGEIQRPDQEVM